MTESGPQHIANPLYEEPTEIAGAWWGLVVKLHEYEDGYLYEAAIPVARHLMELTPDILMLFLQGHMYSTFYEKGINYIAVWYPRQMHNHLLPNGPPSYRYYYAADEVKIHRIFHDWWKTAQEAARSMPPPQTTGPMRVVKRAQDGNNKSLEAA